MKKLIAILIGMLMLVGCMSVFEDTDDCVTKCKSTIEFKDLENDLISKCNRLPDPLESISCQVEGKDKLEYELCFKECRD